MTFRLLILLLICNISILEGQHSHHNIHTEEVPHHKGFRAAVLIGHTLIKSEGTDRHIFIPSWGFDIEYRLTQRWGLALHNDLEIESFVVKKAEQEEVVREKPLVITFDGLYYLSNSLVLTAGPGIELANNSPYYLFRLGAEWEKTIGKGFDISPTVFYDRRFDGFSTWTIALGVGKSF